MKTFVKTFSNDRLGVLTEEINEYAQTNNLKIINVSFDIRPYESLLNRKYAMVVFGKVEEE